MTPSPTTPAPLPKTCAGSWPVRDRSTSSIPRSSKSDVSAPQPTIVATSIGLQPDGPHLGSMRPGPSFTLAAELVGAGAHPKICIIGTATGDDAARLTVAHNAFSKLGMISSHLTLFPMPNVPDMRAHLLAQDVIWVSGGSTANLLSLWRLHGLDVILRECW